MSKTSRIAGILLLAGLPAFAQTPPPEISVAWAYSDDGEAVGKLPKTYWTSDDAVLLLDERVPAAQRTLERVQASTGERRPAFDRARAMANLRTTLADGPETLPWPDSFDRAGRRAAFVIGGRLFVLDLSTSTFVSPSPSKDKVSVARLSPDGRKVAFVRGNDLWVYDLATKAETRAHPPTAAPTRPQRRRSPGSTGKRSSTTARRATGGRRTRRRSRSCAPTKPGSTRWASRRSGRRFPRS